MGQTDQSSARETFFTSTAGVVTDTTYIQHLAAQEGLDGSPVTSTEPVTDEEDLGGPVLKD
ncbi:hypothetical protein ACQUQP_06795 [Marinobacterium sp. YM272]|uniref:hypothetical protein n=1 Tax=Marinobacterium sp. YM272 TaxID=3421654 RepID=UPI003D7F777A